MMILWMDGFCSGKSDTNFTVSDSSFFEKHGIVNKYLEWGKRNKKKHGEKTFILGSIHEYLRGGDQIPYGLFQKRSTHPMEEIGNTPPPDILYKFKAFFRQSLPPPLSGRRKFPLWVGYGSSLEQPYSLYDYKYVL